MLEAHPSARNISNMMKEAMQWGVISKNTRMVNDFHTMVGNISLLFLLHCFTYLWFAWLKWGAAICLDYV